MSKIHILPDILASKIAAGEVVERPASVVKELMENSLDAGARKIEVEVEIGGKKLMRIVDDGDGMTRDDALLAFERYSTSKLAKVEDLESIATLGFRGEALPSIASVSKLILRTKTPAEVAGTEIEIVGGKIKNVRDCAWSQGTEVQVRDLFFNIPARRKFLKSDSTELFHITNLVTHYALAYPRAAFSLAHDGRKLIDVTPVETLKERAYQVFGREFLSNMIEIEHSAENARVYGFASKPTSARANREAQYFFVNGRYVRDRLIGRSLGESYRAILPTGTYPAAILFIETPLGEVDVNVHPAKIEVRFRRPTSVQSAIIEAVQKAIAGSKPVLEIHRTPGAPSKFVGRSRIEVTPPRRVSAEAFRLQAPSEPIPRPPVQSALQVGFQRGGEVQQPGPVGEPVKPPESAEVSGEGPGETAAPQAMLEGRPFLTEQAEEPGVAVGVALPPRVEISPQCLSRPRFAPAPESLGISQIRPFGQLRDSFIIATSPDGLLLIDQHAAHERILFERFRRAIAEKSTAAQPLLLPEVIELTPAQIATYDRIKDELEATGFELGELSGRSIVVNALPVDMPPGEARALILEILEVAEREKRSLTIERLRERIAASLACRAAVKINMALTDQMMNWLIEELFKTSAPSNCPHGRPTVVKMTLREIERLFHR